MIREPVLWGTQTEHRKIHKIPRRGAAPSIAADAQADPASRPDRTELANRVSPAADLQAMFAAPEHGLTPPHQHDWF
jgi:hypothetical protein